MDRTSALDSAFLQLEDDQSALHIASVAIFAGPPPPQTEILAALERRLALVPRLRQRLLVVPLRLGRPVWVDDPGFDLKNQVRRISLPLPGDDAELHAVVDQILTEHLDHDLPLWEDVVIEGLTEDRWALVTKVHHTMVDGIAGTDLLSTVLDHSAEAEVGPVADDCSAEQMPGDVRLVADAVREQAALRLRELRKAPGSLASAMRRPRTVARTAWHTGRGLFGFLQAAAPTSPSSLTGPLGRDRSYRWTGFDLGDVLAVHQQVGGTVNDLVLSVVTHAFRELLLARGELPDPHAVRCLVPVSVRGKGNQGVLDNQVSALLTTLPVELEDAHDRLIETSVRMRALKGSHEAEAGQWITTLADAVPPAALTSFLRLAFRSPHRNLTTVVTNVPGPSTPLFLAGRPMLAAYPYVPIADRLRIGVAVTSYGDQLLLGVTYDRDSTPEVDADVFLNALESGFVTLQRIAERATTVTGASR